MLAIIPARGGSKGVPRKNIKPLAGRPLIHYVIEAALKAGRVTRVVVSTEDQEIAEVAVAGGAEVPFLRPPELATDTAPNGAACLHAIEELGRVDGREAAVFALIQATNPFVQPGQIDAAIGLFEELEPAAVVSVHPFEAPIEAIFELDETRRLRSVLRERYNVSFKPGTRQSYGERYIICGAINVLRTEGMREDPNYYYGHPDALGYALDAETGFDIDTPLDFATAEAIAEHRFSPARS